MARGAPQVEEGYTRLAHELLEAVLRFPFTLRQLKVLLAVARMTYGYQVKRTTLSSSKLANMTGLDAGNVRRTLNELEAIGAVSKQHGFKGQVIGISKHYSKWKACYGDAPVSKQHASRVTVTRAIPLKPSASEAPRGPKDNLKDKESAHAYARAADLQFALKVVHHAFEELDPPPPDPEGRYKDILRSLPPFPGGHPVELREKLEALSHRLGLARSAC